MKKRSKLIALAIVIAVIVVLVAVLIAIFVSLNNNKDKLSGDEQQVYNMNLVLTNDSASNVSEAVSTLQKNNYNLNTLNCSTSGNKYGWDSSTGKIKLLNNEGKISYSQDKANGNAYQIYVVVKTVEDVATWNGYGYSVYLSNLYNGDSVSITKLASVNTEQKKVDVSYSTDMEGTVSVYGKIGTLTIDAENATINNYSNAEIVNINAVANESYHEFGTVNEIDLTKGRLVIEQKSKVNCVFVKTDTVSQVKIKINENYNTTTNDLPFVAFKSETQTSEIANVFESVNQDMITAITSTDNIVNGIDESIISLFGGGYGIKKSPYIISTAKQFANIKKLSQKMKDGSKYYFKQSADIKNFTGGLGSCYFNGEYDGDNHSITAHSSYRGQISIFGYRVTGDSVIKNLNTYSTSKLGLTLVMEPCWNAFLLSLTFDNVKTFGVDNKAYVTTHTNYSPFITGAIYEPNKRDKGADITIKNSINYLNISTSGSNAAAFCGYTICGASKDATNTPNLKVLNCENYGDIYASSTAGLIAGNPSIGAATPKYFVYENVINHSTIYAQNQASIIVANENTEVYKHFNTEANKTAVGGKFISGNVLTDKSFTVYKNDGAYAVEGDIEQNYTYKVELNVGAINLPEGVMNSRRTYVNLTNYSSVSNPENYTNIKNYNFHAYDYNTMVSNGLIEAGTVVNYDRYLESFPITIMNINNNVYIVFDSKEVESVDSNVIVSVVAYKNNVIVGSKVIA